MRQPEKGVTLSQTQVRVVPVESAGLEEVHVMAAFRSTDRTSETGAVSSPTAQSEAIYGAVLEALDDPGGLVIVAERAFGDLAAKDEVLEARTRVLDAGRIRADNPVTYIEGSPCGWKGLSGVNLTLVRVTGDVRTHPLYDGKRLCGYKVTGGDAERAFLSGMTGLDEDGPVPDAVAQAWKMFERTEAVLRGCGLDYSKVVVTRIYLKRLLEWYDEFNAVRNPFHERVGLVKEDGTLQIPASTGIQGKVSEECECVMDVVAVSTAEAPEACPFVRLHNPLQNEATDYGSSFARGVSVRVPGWRYVIVSGTASIDETGASVHVGDPVGQSERTLENFETILRVGGAKPTDLVRTVIYCKDRSYASIFRERMRRRGWPDFPYIVVQADVCRDNLLVEIDGAAVVPS